MFVDHTGPEEQADQPENLSVSDPLFHQTHKHLVVDVIETSSNVSLDDPFVVRRSGGEMVNLSNGVLRSPPRPIPVARHIAL